MNALAFGAASYAILEAFGGDPELYAWAALALALLAEVGVV